MTQKKVKPLAAVDTELLACRDFGHAWKFLTDFDVKRESGRIVSVSRSIECIRCGTSRVDNYNMPDFSRISTKYAYVDGYIITGHKGRIPVSIVRQEIFKRHTVHNKEKKA